MTRRRVGLSALALLVVVLAGLAWWSLRREQSDALPASVPRGADVAPATLPDAGSDPGDASTPRLTAGEQQPLAPAPVQPTAGGGAATTGSLSVAVRWKADGSPAADIGLQLMQLDRPDPKYHATLGRSDEDGRWQVGDLPPGRVVVSSDRLEAQGGWVVAGETLELTIELLPGVLVRGTVVDVEQRPVAGAEIWLDGYKSPGALAVVGQADNAGRFTVRDVRRGQGIGASAPGHTRSGAVRIEDETPHPYDVTIELGPPGGRIEGVVSDPDGRPVAEATVLLSSEHGLQAHKPRPGSNLGFVPPSRLLSDERGVFAADDVPAGWMPLTVRATGWSPWFGDATVVVGQTTEVLIALKPSASVTGVVRDDSGQPMADVHVAVEGRGQMGLQYDFSDAEGRFTLRDLPLSASIDLVAHRDGAGRATTQLKVEAGGSYTWDPVLGTGVLIRGRVIDVRGEPLAGCRITATPEIEEGETSDTKTDADGRFLVDDCADSPHSLHVEAPDSSGGLPVVILTGVRPGPDELEIVVDLGAMAAVVGRVEDAQHRPLEARLWLTQLETRRELEARSDPSTGTFRLGSLPAGGYRLEVESEGLSGIALPDLELAPGEVRDVGTIGLRTPGTLLVRATLPEGMDTSLLAGFLKGMNRKRGAALELQADGTLLSPPLQPGDYRLKLLGGRASVPDRTVRIESGRQIEVDVTLLPCVWLHVDLSLPLREGAPPTVLVEIVDGAHSVMLERQALLTDHADEGQRRATVQGCFPPARYDLRVRVDERLVLEVPIHMDTGETSYLSNFELP